MVPAAYLAVLLPLDLLHHKNNAVKHQLIKAGTWLFNYCRLHAHAQLNMHPICYAHTCFFVQPL